MSRERSGFKIVCNDCAVRRSKSATLRAKAITPIEYARCGAITGMLADAHTPSPRGDIFEFRPRELQ
jgi:hypothetical protein